MFRAVTVAGGTAEPPSTMIGSLGWTTVGDFVAAIVHEGWRRRRDGRGRNAPPVGAFPLASHLSPRSLHACPGALS